MNNNKNNKSFVNQLNDLFLTKNELEPITKNINEQIEIIETLDDISNNSIDNLIKLMIKKEIERQLQSISKNIYELINERINKNNENIESIVKEVIKNVFNKV